MKTRYFIFCCKLKGFPEKMFIVPYQVVEHIFLNPGNKAESSLYIPMEKSAKKRCPSLLDWWQYENAWHLLA